MLKINWKEFPYPGFRNIKTSVAVLLCFAIYEAIGRPGALLAAIAAVICMQDAVDKSIRDGLNRIFGTMMGGLLGVLVALPAFTSENRALMLLACGLGVSLLIYLGVLANMRQSIGISCVVFLIIVSDKAIDAPVLYAVNRVIDTIVGITIAVLVNRFMFNPGSGRHCPKNDDRPETAQGFNYTLKRAGQHAVSTWNGGTTTELYIFPRDTMYGRRNFQWHVSCATVEQEASSFTRLEGFKRHIMLLEGRMRLVHEGRSAVNLERFGRDFFDGEWDTKSFGKGTDFNVLLAKGQAADMRVLEQDRAVSLQSGVTTAFFCLEDGVRMTATRYGNTIAETTGSKEIIAEETIAEEIIAEETLQKHDFIVFGEAGECDERITVVFHKDEPDGREAAVKLDIWREERAEQDSGEAALRE